MLPFQNVGRRQSAAATLAISLVLLMCDRLCAQQELPVWPAVAPGENSLDADFISKVKEAESRNSSERVFGVTQPALTVRLADPSVANGTAVLVCPGGGYNVLAWQKEGLEVADWLNSLGVHAFVLKYRVPRRPQDFMLPPLQDAQRAMRLIRSHADKWQIDSDRVGVLGFSAGGNLSVNLATSKSASYSPSDAVDEFPFRPNFMIPVYAAYLGDSEDDKALNPDLNIDADVPPAFLVVTQDDKNRGIHAALLFAELTRAGVSAELHVYSFGGHGYGLRPSSHPVQEWPKRCEDWLRAMQLLSVRQ